ncbi:MAG TPA: hypothetical protein VFN22_06960 [Gemmatimonadales bacterium]|nr:hypothetical protein [Gemmatimonadales bacterium]
MTQARKATSTDSAAVHHLERLLGGDHPTGHYHWHHVLAAVEIVTATKSARHAALLRRIARFDGRLALDHRHGISHAMPPEEVLRAIAIRTLAAWDGTKHATLIRQVRDHADHDLVALVARDALRK